MKNTEYMLKLAVEDIARMIAKGDAPSAAVTKVAKARGLNMPMTKNAIAATNIALTFNHFEANPGSRDANFKIAELDKVAKELQMPIVEKKAELKIGVNTKIPNFNKLLADENYKAASHEVRSAKEKRSENPYQKDLWDRVEKTADTVRRRVEDAEVEKIGAEQRMDLSFAEIVDSFTDYVQPYRVSFAEFEKQAFAIYGKPVGMYLDHVYKTAKLKEARGEHDAGYLAYKECKELKNLRKFMQAKEAYFQAEGACEKAAVAMLQYKEAKKKLMSLVGDVELPKTETTQVQDVETKKKTDEAEEAAKFLTPEEQKLPSNVQEKIVQTKKAALPELDRYVSEKLGFEFGDLPFGKEIDDRAASMSKIKPSTTAGGSNNLDRKLILLELMHTDPILAHAPKLNVLQSYSQLLQLAPNVALNKELVRAQLRSMISGQALSLFDGKQLAETDNVLEKQRRMHEGSLMMSEKV